MGDVQGLVDALAIELDRPVGLDDRRFRAIAYSSHPERVDQVRLASILQREAPREVTEWLEELGVREAETFLKVPANEGFSMSARVCLPVRFDGTLLGFLWLIDEPEPLSDEELEEAARCREEIAVALYRARVLERGERERERDLLARALGHAPGDGEAAARELVTGGCLATAPAYLVLVLRACRRRGEEVTDPIRVRLADAAEQMRRAMAPHHMVVLVCDEEVVAVLAASAANEVDRRAGSLAALAKEHLAGHPEWEVVVGAGEEVELGRLTLSYRQAGEAARAARAIGRSEPFVRWDSLGAYRTLVGLTGGRDLSDRVPESLLKLLSCSEAETLTETLERYLDLGGDARAAAASLYIHRSSLYGRLHRIEEIAGVDLHSGEDRLELHLGLRILRLSGALRD